MCAAWPQSSQLASTVGIMFNLRLNLLVSCKTQIQGPAGSNSLTKFCWLGFYQRAEQPPIYGWWSKFDRSACSELCVPKYCHSRHLEWENKGHIQCGNHISQNHILQLYKTAGQLANQPKMTKVYREKRYNLRQNLSFHCRMLKILSLSCRKLKFL